MLMQQLESQILWIKILHFSKLAGKIFASTRFVCYNCTDGEKKLR